jgi:hypothetical protein
MVINSLLLSGVERDALNGFTQRSSLLRSSRYLHGIDLAELPD